MTEENSDSADFKPFFDLVVGILFILLILIASQLFFTRYDSAPSPAEAAARAREARRILQQAAVERLLDDLAERLRESGFAPTVDRLERSVSVQAGEMLRDATLPARYAQALAGATACGSDASERACAGPSLVRIERVALVLHGLDPQASGDMASPEARLAALRLSTRLYEAAPALLELRAGSGGALLHGPVAATGFGEPGGPFLTVDFDFPIRDIHSSDSAPPP